MRVGEFQGLERSAGKSWILLELAAADDLIGFRNAVEEDSLDIDGFGLWYGRRVGLKKIGLEERTPLMVASMYGSERVLTYILETGNVDINRACGSDAATALHCAVVGGSSNILEVVKLLLDASADANCIDVEGNRPFAVTVPFVSSLFDSRSNMLQLMINGCTGFDKAFTFRDNKDKKVSSPPHSKDGTEGKDYGSDEFRMYTFKIKSCSRAYSHDWTECPFVHPGENARRRDPRTFHYSCVPCLEFRKGTCRQGDTCEYAHGIFECWLHPAQYRTRLCKHDKGCSRKVCFFAHKREELRPLYTSTGSGVHSPRSVSVPTSLDFSTISPLTLGSPAVMIPPSSTPMTSSRQSTPMVGSMWSNQSNFAHPNLGLSGSRLRSTSHNRDMYLKAELLSKESHRSHQQQLSAELCGFSSPAAWNNPFLSSAAFAASQGYNNRKPSRFLGMKLTNLDDVFGSRDPSIVFDIQGQSLDARTTQLQSSTGLPMHRSMNQKAFGNESALAATSASLATARSSAFAQKNRSSIDQNTKTHHSGISSTSSANMMPSAMADWVP